jgi:hypothetical protein
VVVTEGVDKLQEGGKVNPRDVGAKLQGGRTPVGKAVGGKAVGGKAGSGKAASGNNTLKAR